jgi:hypothetical protein
MDKKCVLLLCLFEQIVRKHFKICYLLLSVNSCKCLFQFWILTIRIYRYQESIYRSKIYFQFQFSILLLNVFSKSLLAIV